MTVTPQHAQAIRERVGAIDWMISSTGHVSWRLDADGSSLDLTSDGRSIPRYVVSLDSTATGLAECRQLAEELRTRAARLDTIISTAEGLERRAPMQGE